MNPNDYPLYAGIAGLDLPYDEFDLGHGVILKRTYAHIMAPYLAAFAPAEAGKPHPAPWKAVGGGLGLDVQAELCIPLEFALSDWFDRLNTVWWLVALMRFKASSVVRVPVIANKPFSAIPLSQDEPHFWTMEMEPYSPVMSETVGESLDEAGLHWIGNHWVSGGRLANESGPFSMAFQALDGYVGHRSPSLAMVSLWGALERLFSPSNYELSFRVSAAIASYLEAPGKERLELHRHVKRLYDARSKVAHGFLSEGMESSFETHVLLKRALTKMMEEDHIPSRAELESLLFGAA